MNALARLIGLVCVCAVAVSILNLIKPEGFTSRTMNMIAGVFAVAAVVIPLTGIVRDFSLDINLPDKLPEYSDSAEKAFDEAVLSETAERLDSEHLSMLRDKGYSVKRVKFYLSITENSGIIIDSVSIYIDEAENRISGIIKLVQDSCGTVPQLIEE